MIQKITIIAVVALFGIGYYAAEASSAIATEDVEIAYVEINAQTFTSGNVALDATRDTFNIEMKTVVQYPVDRVVISSGYGPRLAACHGCSTDHKGVDYTPGRGTPIYAIAHGVVTESGWNGGYGQVVRIEHTINGQRVESLYAHMQAGSLRHRVGDTVYAGDIIGAVGNTGVSTGPHLHFEIHVNGININPSPWLTNNVNIGAWDHLP